LAPLDVDLERESDHETTAASASGVRSDLDELGKLAELHAAGVLTDEEFATTKAKLLGM